MAPRYDFVFTTYMDVVALGNVTVGLRGTVFWYNSGTTLNGYPVYLSADGDYHMFRAPFWYITKSDSFAIGFPYDYFYQIELTTQPTLEFVGGNNSTWTGALTGKYLTITDAWPRAEAELYDRLANYCGGTGEESFLGVLPTTLDGTQPSKVNAWAMRSGGSQAYKMERVKGDHPTWESMRADVVIDSLWKTREEAMQFAGTVIQFLEAYKNFGGTTRFENIMWVALAEMPAEPTQYLTKGRNRRRYWRQRLDLEMVYTTGTTFYIPGYNE